MKILGNQMYKTKINATFKKNTKKQKWTQGKKRNPKRQSSSTSVNVAQSSSTSPTIKLSSAQSGPGFLQCIIRLASTAKDNRSKAEIVTNRSCIPIKRCHLIAATTYKHTCLIPSKIINEWHKKKKHNIPAIDGMLGFLVR